MKLQIAFRDLEHVRNGLKVVVASGLIEYPDHSAPSEMIAAFEVPFAPEQDRSRPASFKNLNSYRHARGIHEGGVPDYASDDVSSFATKHVWLTPRKPGDCEMFLRRTRMSPSSGGLEVMAFTAMAAVHRDARVDDQAVMQYRFDGDDTFLFEGRVGEDLKPEWGAPDMKARTAGNSLMAFLREPVWGFGTEPMSLPSSMRLDFLDRLDEYRELELQAARTEEGENRLRRLEPEMRSQGMALRDEDYREFLDVMRVRGEIQPASQPMTRAECERLERISREIVEEIFEGKAAALRR